MEPTGTLRLRPSAGLLRLAALTLVLCGGCTTPPIWNLRGEGYPETPAASMSAWTKSLRSKENGGSPFGWDSRTREIESSLGVR